MNIASLKVLQLALSIRGARSHIKSDYVLSPRGWDTRLRTYVLQRYQKDMTEGGIKHKTIIDGVCDRRV